MKNRTIAALSMIVVLHAGSVVAEVSAVEAAQLGAALTPFGSEQAGNAAGTVPAYTGGLPVTTSPPGFTPGSGRWTNPFPDEKPLFSITAKNLDQYRDALSETGKELFKRQASYRMDVYPSHRSVAYPAWVLDNTRKNATQARLAKDGVALEGAYGGIPFPIPKNGNEVMWNHLLVYTGVALDSRSRAWYVDDKGLAVNSSAAHFSFQNNYYDPQSNAEEFRQRGNTHYQNAYNYLAPPSWVGFANLDVQTLDPTEQPRRYWSYAPTNRRVRELTDVMGDMPANSLGALVTADEMGLFDNALDGFDFKLLGKRDMLIPYNNHALLFETSAAQLLTPGYLNPDFVRWEWHRVWVVEATLKPGKHHVFQRRVFYFDEDWSGAGMSDEFAATGELSRGLFRPGVPLYDVQVQMARVFWGYDLKKNMYVFGQHFGEPGFVYQPRPRIFPPMSLTPDALARRGAF